MTTAAAFTTDEERWNAIEKRNRQADGAFLYGVRTTGVYCRPSCSSRLPKRSNVKFFATCEQAERGGYRACKKCKPKASGPDRVPEAVLRACQLIEDADDSPSLEQLARVADLSPYYFHRLFKEVVGVTPKAYTSARRAERFREGLQNQQPVTQAMYGAGFGSSSRCYEGVSHDLGMTPTDYKNGGAGQSIRFIVVECYLGWVAVAGTERGVCLIEFGDTPGELRAEVVARFPKANVLPADDTFERLVRQVVMLIEAPDGGLELPLDIQGTAFQRKVWEALRALPAGTTATYAEIAQRIGQPHAARAVAQACAANQLAVVIPCHRVVRTDGDQTGYRWGAGRKRMLLDREAGHRSRP